MANAKMYGKTLLVSRFRWKQGGPNVIIFVTYKKSTCILIFFERYRGGAKYYSMFINKMANAKLYSVVQFIEIRRQIFL